MCLSLVTDAYSRKIVGHRTQEAMTPEEGGVFADPATYRGLADGLPFDEGLCVVFPTLGFAQPGQRRLGEHRAGAQTLCATVTT